MSKIGAWFNEPEFNRWYFKWSLFDWIRAGIAVIAIKLIQTIPFQNTALAFLLGVLAVVIVAVLFGVRQRSTELQPLITIQSPAGGRVPLFKIVRGCAHPSPALVQVMILAGPINDRRWFPQPDAEISRYEWRAKCRFGDQSAPATGWEFDFCAVIPRTRITDTVKDIPADAIVSQIIHVSLDRGLPDEDFP
ncbi:hypothetical protein [Candidatus Binatus sp.]|uniref:hypothetical protein n=1 Tax=Candidatus Binatus sp. TaxID=2811406 RepID=UPI003C9141FA